MATLRTKWKLAAVSREIPETTRNSQSHNTLDPGKAQGYISQVFGEIEGKRYRKLSKEFNRTESRILGALPKLNEFLLDPQVVTCSVAVLGTSRNNDSENREPTEDRSLGDPSPEAVFFTYHSINLNDSEQEETHHSGCFSTRTARPKLCMIANGSKMCFTELRIFFIHEKQWIENLIFRCSCYSVPEIWHHQSFHFQF